MKVHHFYSCLLIASGIPLLGNPGFAQGASMFPDVPTNHWAYESVKALKELGILEGYPPESKRPRVRTFFTSSALRPSDTLTSEHWAYASLRRLAANGIVELPSYSCFPGPQSSRTQTWSRYEFAICVKRGMEQYAALAVKHPGALDRSSRILLIELADEFRTELRDLGVKRLEDYERILLASPADAAR
jgi:hypothetical protein